MGEFEIEKEIARLEREDERPIVAAGLLEFVESIYGPLPDEDEAADA